MTRNRNDGPCSVWKFPVEGNTDPEIPDLVYEGRRVDCEAYRDGALSRNSVGATYTYKIAELSSTFED